MQFLFKDVRALWLSLALVLYGVLGSPTPDYPGFIEVIIGLLLIAAISPIHYLHQFTSYLKAQERWQIAALLLFIYGLFVPVIMALTQAVAFVAIARDVIAFAFLCLPFFLFFFFHQKPKRQKIFWAGLIFIGLFFSLRVLTPHLGIDYLNVAQWNPAHENIQTLYLTNSPLVLFAMIYLLSRACQILYQKINMRHVALFGLYGAGAVLMIMAVFVDVQRAFLAALVISTAVLFVLGAIKAPFRIITPLALLFLGGLIFYDVLAEIYSQVYLKTSRVGFNMRLQEWQAVWEGIRHNPFTVIFGQGWGAHFASPAVGDYHVTYTHSLLSYMLFKTGIIGLFLTLGYLFFIFEKLVSVSLRCPVKGNALFWAFIIPIMLYASYKSLDYGLLLTAVTVSAMAREGLDPATRKIA
jgi:hypothetical protein